MADLSKTGSSVAFDDQKPDISDISRKEDVPDAFQPSIPLQFQYTQAFRRRQSKGLLFAGVCSNPKKQLLWRAPTTSLETQKTKRILLALSDKTSRRISLAPVPGNRPPNHENATNLKLIVFFSHLIMKFYLIQSLLLSKIKKILIYKPFLI